MYKICIYLSLRVSNLECSAIFVRILRLPMLTGVVNVGTFYESEDKTHNLATIWY